MFVLSYFRMERKRENCPKLEKTEVRSVDERKMLPRCNIIRSHIKICIQNFMYSKQTPDYYTRCTIIIFLTKLVIEILTYYVEVWGVGGLRFVCVFLLFPFFFHLHPSVRGSPRVLATGRPYEFRYTLTSGIVKCVCLSM